MSASARRRALVLGALCAAAAVVALVYSLGGEPRERAPEASVESLDEDARAQVPSEVELDMPEREAAAIRGEDALEEAPVPARSALGEREPEGEIWIRGRVEFPEGVVPDASARVVRHALVDDEWIPRRSFPIEEGGSFRIPFPSPTQRAFLDLTSRVACVSTPVRVDPLDPSTDVVFAAKLASGLRGRLRVDPDAAGEAPGFVGAKLVASNFSRRAPSKVERTVETDVDGSLAFELDGLDPEASYELRLMSGSRIRARSQRVQVVAGKRAEFELEVPAATRLSGHVVDRTGAGVAGVQVFTKEVYDGRTRERGHASTQTEADGTFVASLYEGTLLGVRACKPGYAPVELPIEPMDSGETRSGFVIALERGPEVSGRVVWPDGTPAQDALVVVEAGYSTDPSQPPRRDYEVDTRTDEHGTFRANVSTGLPVTVRARASRTGERLSKGDATRWRSGPDSRVTNTSVTPGGAAIELVLEENARLTAVVEDDAGNPIPRFEVRVKSATWTVVDRGEDFDRTFDAPDGRFALDQLTAGPWLVEVAASDQRVTSALVAVAGTTEQRFVIPRAARVSGTVVDARGVPVGGAQVWLGASVERDAKASASRVHLLFAACDAQGRFAIDEVRAGPLEIRARSGGRQCEPMKISALPGEALRDVRVVLP